MANRKSYHQDEKKRSAFGELLHQELLDATKDRKRITQKQIALRSSEIAQRSGRDEDKIAADELSRLITGEHIPYDHTLFNHLYAIFKAISEERQVPLSADQVTNILAAKEIQSRLNEDRKQELIAKLKGELIIKDIRYTRQGIEFIGREKDIAEILTNLKDKRTQRFLTLTGVPGVGKSELARCIKDIVQTQEVYTNVRLVPLETVYDSDGLMKVISEELLRVDLRQGTSLLILDNCEQIKELEDTAEKIYLFLEEHSNLTIFATSRHDFSHAFYEVKTLLVPEEENEPLERLLSNEAVQLFREGVTRSQKEKYTLVENDAPLIARICQLLDGLPLGLLIASAWSQRKGIQGLYESLLNMSMQTFEVKQNRPKYHITLDALINHSYELLDEKEQTLLRWIAAFPSDCKTEAVISICSIGNLFGSAATPEQFSEHIRDTEKLLDTLERHHLITYIDNVIGMHNTIRRFGRGMLNSKKEGYQEWGETKELFYWLMRYNSSYRCKTYLERKYNPQELLSIARSSDFLENGSEDHTTIKNNLDEILDIAAEADVDCFRRHHPFYPTLLDMVIERYLHKLVVGLADTDQKDVPLDHTTLTADERREVFFITFDIYYKANLLAMLIDEGERTVRSLFTHVNLERIWEVWDILTSNVVGLSVSRFIWISQPGNTSEITNVHNIFVTKGI